MKIAFIIITFICCAVTANAQDKQDTLLTADQLSIRTELMEFLKDEGYKPKLYNYNHILFKKESVPVVISIDENQISPFLISCFIQFDYDEQLNKKTAEKITPEINRYLGLKSVVYNDAIRVCYECFILDKGGFIDIFQKVIAQLFAVKLDLGKIIEDANTIELNIDELLKDTK